MKARKRTKQEKANRRRKFLAKRITRLAMPCRSRCQRRALKRALIVTYYAFDRDVKREDWGYVVGLYADLTEWETPGHYGYIQ